MRSNAFGLIAAGIILQSTAGAVVLIAASAHADEVGCSIPTLYGAASKFASCEAKATADVFGGTVGTDDAAFLKCRQRYAATWTKLATRYPGTCAGARFVDNGLTITDNLTQLIWEKKTTVLGSGTSDSDRHDVDNFYSWSATSTNADGAAFTDFLDNLNATGFAGQHDWRLPTLFELQSIVATDAFPCSTAPCVADPLFAATQSDAYWSSSTLVPGSSGAYYVDFSIGLTDYTGDKTVTHYVRAVRGGF